MTQTEWIISLDDDLKDYDELFVGNLRDGDRLIRCKDCKYWDEYYCRNRLYGNGYANYIPPIKTEDGFCDWAERKEE
ncbi:MAG: hypothetical protein IKD75_01520 [Prevotella sp.]|nr:hypothetical protein [Prevotella sp.]